MKIIQISPIHYLLIFLHVSLPGILELGFIYVFFIRITKNRNTFCPYIRCACQFIYIWQVSYLQNYAFIRLLKGILKLRKKNFNNTPTKKCFFHLYLKYEEKKYLHFFFRSIFTAVFAKKEFFYFCPFPEVNFWTIQTRFVAFASEL